jgi:hypothetical protein
MAHSYSVSVCGCRLRAAAASSNFPLAMLLLIFGGGIMFSFYPVFWSMPTAVLSETAAAACFGLINAVGHVFSKV